MGSIYDLEVPVLGRKKKPRPQHPPERLPSSAAVWILVNRGYAGAAYDAMERADYLIFAAPGIRAATGRAISECGFAMRQAVEFYMTSLNTGDEPQWPALRGPEMAASP
jgi:hypothetical protein